MLCSWHRAIITSSSSSSSSSSVSFNRSKLFSACLTLGRIAFNFSSARIVSPMNSLLQIHHFHVLFQQLFPDCFHGTVFIAIFHAYNSFKQFYFFNFQSYCPLISIWPHLRRYVGLDEGEY